MLTIPSLMETKRENKAKTENKLRPILTTIYFICNNLMTKPKELQIKKKLNKIEFH